MAELLTYPDQRLLQISGLIRHFDDPGIDEVIKQMRETMQEHNLKALSAIQIGYPYRIILFKKNGNIEVMINPVIYGKEGQRIKSLESDESLPGAELEVERFEVVKIMYQDREGKDKFFTAKGEDSIILQRKIDMVFGGYLFDKLSKKEQKRFFKEYGSYGDTCPTSFVKDKILTALRIFLVLHFLLLLFSWTKFASFVLNYNTALFGIELIWIIIYALYAKYETTKYKNCTSCQGANVFGTSALYGAVTLLLFGGSWLLKSFLQ